MPFARSAHPGLPIAFALAFGLASSGTLAAQTPACGAEEHRQFDFWIGRDGGATWGVAFDGHYRREEG